MSFIFLLWSMKYYLCDMWPVLILKLGSLWSRKCKIIWRACLSHNFTYLFSEFWRVQRFCPNDSTQQTVSSFQNDQQKIWQWKGSFFVEKEPASPGRPERTLEILSCEWSNSIDPQVIYNRKWKLMSAQLSILAQQTPLPGGLWIPPSGWVCCARILNWILTENHKFSH